MKEGKEKKESGGLKNRGRRLSKREMKKSKTG